MGDNFIKLPSGTILNISGIESLVIITKTINKVTDTVQYEKCLRIVTKSGNILYENANCLDTILKEIYIVNAESEQQ